MAKGEAKKEKKSKDLEVVDLESEKNEVVEDTSSDSAQESSDSKPEGKFQKFTAWYKANKKKSIPLTILAVLALLLIIPTTRYKVLGIFIKRDFSILVLDDKTHEPITDARAEIDGVSGTTNNEGKIKLHVKVGKFTLSITKNYYETYNQPVTVAVGEQQDDFLATVKATGRQVPVAVNNKITGAAVENAAIKVLDTQATTDDKGLATIVLPLDKDTQQAVVSADGYNETKTTVKVTENKDDQNNLNITPEGKLYFLSKRTGKINLMKANLDGTDGKVVVAGTGNEDETDTVLLTNRDWKYLALKSKRSGDNASLYAINTSNDQLREMDSGDASFTPIGWFGNYFLYKVDRNNVEYWQSKHSSLKSYNAETGQLVTLDNTSGKHSERYEDYGDTHLLNNLLIFTKSWCCEDNSQDKNTINAIKPDGSGRQTIKSFSNSDFGYINSIIYKPEEVIFSVYNYNGEDHFYEYDNGAFNRNQDLSRKFDRNYPTYLFSPNGEASFWSESRDGKKTLLIGDSTGSSEKEVASLTEYNAYGWFGEDYLLASKDDSELYILGVKGLKGEQKALKVTDYHKPDYDSYGYGYGYGG